MKIYIGPYRNRWTCQLHYNYMNKKYGYQWEDNHNGFERFLEKVEDVIQTVLNATVNQIADRLGPQKRKIHIDRWDTWSMDSTLALIVVPMLKQLRNTKHGCPIVDLEDVPEDMRQEDTDENIDHMLARWNWILDEMIFAFEKSQYDWATDDFCTITHVEKSEEHPFGVKVERDVESIKTTNARIQNGRMLFAKYYEALWD